MDEATPDLSLILKALAFAAHKHKDQRRKGVDVSPYINHPIALANVLCNEGGITDSKVICGALLHDTVEDTDTTFEELEAEFGREIRDIVMDVTDDKGLPKHERKRLQIEHAARASGRARLVKIADKICNLRDIIDNPPSDWSTERKEQYFEWAKKVVDQVRGAHPLLERVFNAVYERKKFK